jgi:hypothetical protein
VINQTPTKTGIKKEETTTIINRHRSNEFV